MGSSRGSYGQRWREPSDEEIYEDIRRSLEEDEYDSYQRGGSGGSNNQRGGGSGSGSSNNQRGGGSNSSFHTDSAGKLKRLAESYEKIKSFFEILGEDIEMYLMEEEQPPSRRGR